MQDININFSGATYTVYSGGLNTFQLLGTGTLAANYTISATGTYYEGNKFVFYFKAEVDKAAFNFNILGTNLSTTQLNRESTITAVYNGTSWDLNIQPNTKSVNWINPNDLMSTGADEVIIVPVSFEAGEQCSNYVNIPFNCEIIRASFTTTKALANTDAGSVVIVDDLMATTITTLTIPLSTALNIRVTQSGIGYLYENADETTTISFQSSKTTVGGKGLVSLVVKRT